jgi:K+-sensing histidine kinase KdpD
MPTLQGDLLLQKGAKLPVGKATRKRVTELRQRSFCRDISDNNGAFVISQIPFDIAKKSTRKHRNTTSQRRRYWWRLISMEMLLRYGMFRSG